MGACSPHLGWEWVEDAASTDVRDRVWVTRAIGIIRVALISLSSHCPCFFLSLTFYVCVCISLLVWVACPLFLSGVSVLFTLFGCLQLSLFISVCLSLCVSPSVPFPCLSLSVSPSPPVSFLFQQLFIRLHCISPSLLTVGMQW